MILWFGQKDRLIRGSLINRDSQRTIAGLMLDYKLKNPGSAMRYACPPSRDANEKSARFLFSGSHKSHETLFSGHIHIKNKISPVTEIFESYRQSEIGKTRFQVAKMRRLYFQYHEISQAYILIYRYYALKWAKFRIYSGKSVVAVDLMRPWANGM